MNRVSGLILPGLLVAACGASNASERLDYGQQVYLEHCASCHDTGAKGAPVLGRAKDWVDRSRLWEAVLYEHANAGYLGMPAKGGAADLTEYDVDAAAEYMLTITHGNLPAD